MLKKFASVLLCALLLIGFVPSFTITASAANSGVTGDCTWVLDGTVLTISGNGAMANTSYDSHPWGFGVTQVIINDGVTKIGDYAFYKCTNLTSVTIPDSVTSIGSDAFNGCTKLESIELPDSITELGSFVFYGCTKLTNVNIPKGVTEILYMTFYNCKSLKSIVIPSNVKTIGLQAFYDCTALESVTLKEGLQTIGGSAFNNCTALKSVTIPKTVNTISSRAFSYCTGLESVTIEDGVKIIEEEAFNNCYRLKSAIVPGSVTSIDDLAFKWCDVVVIKCPKNSVAEEYCKKKSKKYEYLNQDYTYTAGTGDVTITGFVGDDSEVVIPETIDGRTVTAIGEKAFYTSRNLKSVTIPSTVKTIGANAFRGCTALTKINFNEGLETIGTYAFGGTKLETIKFPSTLKTIGVSAFNGVTTLTDVDFASVQSIKGSAFAGCTSLGTTASGTRIVIPETVTEIGANAFLNCTGFTRIDWHPEKLNSGAAGNKDNPAFQGCTGLREARIEESAVYIPSYLFYKAGNPSERLGITSLSFKGTPKVREIGDYAFYQARFGTVTFPDTLTKIGRESFRNVNALTTINFGTGVKTIGQQAFSNCNNLESVNIPGNVETLYAYAFRNCSALKTVVIEEGVTYISSYVFMGTSLKSITLPASLTKINSGLTYNTDATIYYPAGSYVDSYLHSAAAKIKNETLVPIV